MTKTWLALPLILASGFTAPAADGVANQAESPPEPFFLSDGVYRNACGPIACYVAAREVGEHVTLAEMARACRWQEGHFTSLGTMHRALSGCRGVKSIVTWLSPAQLRDVIRTGRYAAILAIRHGSQEIDHAVCVTSAGDEGVTLVDYPMLRQTLTWDELADDWDGHAILVSKSWFGWCRDKWVWVALPSLASVFLIGSGLRQLVMKSG